MYRMIFLILAVVVLVSLSVGVAAGEEEGFDTDLNLGFSLNDGNSETMQANVALNTEGQREDLGSVQAGAEFNYGESTVDDERDTTIDNFRVFAGARKTLTEMTFLSMNAEYEHDEIADVDYRASLSPGGGYYVFKRDSGNLSFDIGPSYVWEEVSGARDDYLAVRLLERFEHELSSSSKCWQSLEYLPGVDDLSDYLLSAELGIEAAINSHMNLRVVLKDKYDSTPGDGNEENDLSLMAGVGIAL